MFTTGENKHRVSYAFLTVAWKLFEYNKRLQSYGTDKTLYESEVHMIMHIKDNPELHVSGIADKIGVTKGAVSQTVSKLEKKGMIVKKKDAQNNSRTLLQLTDKGEIAYEAHRRMHEEFDQEVERLLKEAGADKVDFIKEFLVKIEEYVDSMG